MSSLKLKPLLLPQLVQERRKLDGQTSSDVVDVSSTINSFESDVESPVTPIVSPRGLFHRLSSSSSSSPDLPPPPETPSSPTTQLFDKRLLPDVQEDPMERYEEDAMSFSSTSSEHFGLYSCLCDTPCQHRSSSEGLSPDDMMADFDLDYDMGFMSDGDSAADPRQPPKKRAADNSSPFAGLTSRIGSRLPTIKRWRSNRRANAAVSSPLTDLSLENVFSRGPSSRSSSLSASNQQTTPERLSEMPPAPSSSTTVSYFASSEDLSGSSLVDMTPEEQSNLERDRSMATTPLLPPLLTDPLGKPPQESPLQSPTVAPTPAAATAAAAVPPASSPPPPPAPAGLSSPTPLSTRPSLKSLRQVSTATTVATSDMPLPLPAILQEQDEWSDRLGHANFTITPLPYELETLSAETVGRFRDDWDAARVNYTKHLVRTGEHYGQTSKIYALTEAKWAETERRWKRFYDDMVRQGSRPALDSGNPSRSHSRGRGRGRSSSSVPVMGRLHSSDDVLADLDWRRMDDCLPSAVPRMLESLDAQGKFPCRGDEDIVGPMQRAAVMARARSEDAKGHFWRSIADKVGFRK
ncbi:only proline and serine are matching in the corresponding protein [Ophiocordyceps camponoti-floridani]|uniref:Only proline and serine are matching in the corresponding protein n=1 Tax=Ophiocordyceps camponoti-floridani TaxID=2030778 RepID=A0A8H4QC57_9HYPO|nr:only proline and serine are matching in the corresponding protein [Ophiocordyceps camponoti-floridani]